MTTVEILKEGDELSTPIGEHKIGETFIVQNIEHKAQYACIQISEDKARVTSTLAMKDLSQLANARTSIEPDRIGE
jgi:hypothetical protein